MTADADALQELARAHGVETGYHDVGGAYHAASDDTLLAVLRGLGVPVHRPIDAVDAIARRRDELATRVLPAVVAAWDDEPVEVWMRSRARDASRVVECGVHLEDGASFEWRARIADLPASGAPPSGRGEWTARRLVVPGPLPFGVHQLRTVVGERAYVCALIVAPRRGASSGPPFARRSWGTFLPLYALHSERSGATGDLGDLDDLAELVAERGGTVVATLPLLAAFLDDPCEVSPYSPVSRRFWNELYIDLERVAELRWSPEAAAKLASCAFEEDVRAMREERWVPYRRGAAQRREVLELLARAVATGPPERLAAFRNSLAERPEVAKYARFRALGERHGTNWREWPARMREGVIGFTDVDPVADRYHRYVQWIVAEQLEQLASRLRRRGQVLALDLPLGCHPDGYDVWAAPERYATDMSVGAPPDAFEPAGQSWGFPPERPDAMCVDAFANLRSCLAEHLKYAGLLRIDHVMGLHRLWWVPDGFAASAGAYVRYPAEQLWATLCLEAHRHRADIVGENLGTVPDEVNEAIDRHGARRMHVVEFELDPRSDRAVRDAPANAIAMFGTHDTATFAGWWGAADLEARADGDRRAPELLEQLRAERGAGREALWSLVDGDDAETGAEAGRHCGVPADALPAVLDAVHARLADGDADVVIVNLEDTWLEREPQNVPGVVDVRNWRRKARRSLEQMRTDAATAARLAVLRERRPRRVDPLVARSGRDGADGAEGGDGIAAAANRLTPLDLYLLAEGRHYTLHEKLGAHPIDVGGVTGTSFAVWAPDASEVSVIGGFNGWQVGSHPMGPVRDSGVWAGFVPGVGRGDVYKYAVRSRHGGEVIEKADPLAYRAEAPPRTASIVWDLDYEWRDAAWMARRRDRQQADRPLSIYEVHLGSWRRVPAEGDRRLGYRELAPLLAEYAIEMGYTHVEFLPVMEHPFYGSWGYQTTGYFAPTARYGTPQDLMYLIDHLHHHGIGVILDWVPSHFPSDGHGLAWFDGSHLYEHADESQRVHPDWGSYLFNYGRNEVRSFLVSCALYWLECFHADGLRTDAVASMLYLDYSREEGEWVPNRYGGNENLEALDFIRECNAAIGARVPDALTFAEESTAWAGVTMPTSLGGLGFWFKWDLGWMHDTLQYFGLDPVHRRYHHDELTFRSIYATSEQFLLPLSHDEVVHEKGALIERMPGDEWQQRANLRLLYGYQHGLPGKKLLFMGDDFGSREEWDHQRSLPWHLLEDEAHRGIARWVAWLNRLHAAQPALHELDRDPDGFEWVDCSDRDASVLSWLRFGHDRAEPVLVVANFTPVPRDGYLVGTPQPGPWRLLANSDAVEFGGSGYPVAPAAGSEGTTVVEATGPGASGRPDAVELALPPLGILFLGPERGGGAETGGSPSSDGGRLQ